MTDISLTDRRRFRRHSGDARTANDPPLLARAIVDQLFYIRGTLPEQATRNDWYLALAYAVRDRLLDKWIRTARTLMQKEVKVVAYLSAEYLTGPHLANNVVNLGIEREVREATDLLGLSFDELVSEEGEPGLGNGGLGRLAACYLDSLATLEIPAIGYGIRYEFGIFDQQIRDGWQVERTDKWLASGNPWQIPRGERACLVGFGGRTEIVARRGRPRPRPMDSRTPRSRHPVRHADRRLSRRHGRICCASGGPRRRNRSISRRSTSATTTGRSMEKVVSENITKVLYPERRCGQGQAAAPRAAVLLRVVLAAGHDPPPPRVGRSARPIWSRDSPSQLNDTHPSIAVRRADATAPGRAPARLGHGVGRDPADAGLHEPHTAAGGAGDNGRCRSSPDILPRHLEIVFEINRRFLDEVRVAASGRRGAGPASVDHR